MRLPRVSLPGVLYHIQSVGDHGRNVFEDAKDYENYIGLLKKYKERFGFKLHAFSLVPSELDLLVELDGDASLSQILHALNSSYTKQFNSRHVKKGHLFQERPRVKILEKSQYLLPLSLFVHQKPARLGFAVEPETYAYSSCKAFSGSEPEGLQGLEFSSEVKEMEEALAQSGVSGTYLERLHQLDANQAKEIEQGLLAESILGSEAFKQEVKVAMDKAKKDNQAQPKPNKVIIPAGAAGLVLMLLISTVLYTRTVAMKETFHDELAIQRVEMNERLKDEKEKVYNDLDEKYRADKVSLMAAQKRIEIERQKNRELEERLQS